MNCRMEQLREKEVINIRDGARIGFLGDIEVDTKTAALTALIVHGKLRLFGLLGREEDITIPWNQIQLIGDDIVLVDLPLTEQLRPESALSRVLKKIGWS